MEQNKDYVRPIVIVSVLMLGIMYQTNTGAFVPLINSIAGEFIGMRQDMMPDQVGWLISLPSLLMIPGVLLNGLFIQKFRMRSVMVFSWALFGLSGAAIYLCTTTAALFTCRALMGLAIGLCQPSTRALPSRMYDDTWRSRVLGWISMAGGIISMLLSLAVGRIALVDWRLAMLLFIGLAIIFIIFALIFVPNLPVEEKPPKVKTVSGETKKRPFGSMMWLLVICAFIIYTVGAIIQIKTSIVVEERGIGGPDMASYVSMASTSGIIIGGLLFGFFYNRFGRGLFPAALLVSAAAYFWFAYAKDIASLCISGFITGFAPIGIVMVYYVTRITYVTPRERVTMALLIVTLATYLGQVCTTPVMNFIESIWGTATYVSLTMVGVVFAVVGVIAIIFILATRKVNFRPAELQEAKTGEGDIKQTLGDHEQ